MTTTQTAAFPGSLLLGAIMEPKEIGKRIKAARERRGWTQMTLAMEANVSISTVTRWERGILPPVRELIRLAGVLEIAPEELVDLPPTPEDQIAAAMQALQGEVAEVREMVAELLGRGA